MSDIAKVVELVGSSATGWQDAVERAVEEASKSIRHISGVEVTNMTVQMNENKMMDWRVTVKVAFGIEGNASS